MVHIFTLHCASGVKTDRRRASGAKNSIEQHGVPAWPAGRPREYQHGLLVVQGSISMACWSSQPSVPQHTHLRAHICLVFLPFPGFSQTTHGIASSVSHGSHRVRHPYALVIILCLYTPQRMYTESHSFQLLPARKADATDIYHEPQHKHKNGPGTRPIHIICIREVSIQIL